ncbi:hypothetical protein [Aeromonas dhakensis]|jgi:hypothetical protein|uniref:hypothetical protein n=1 Tax=Aeromonas dhakensis TaxID=196024 RepID=UPI0018A7A543|nr:hypothetical protein [Aeromonas dhakensis]MBF8450173.1 hypothetical protein [Aeromonas dhakensis]
MCKSKKKITIATIDNTAGIGDSSRAAIKAAQKNKSYTSYIKKEYNRDIIEAQLIKNLNLTDDDLKTKYKEYD